MQYTFSSYFEFYTVEIYYKINWPAQCNNINEVDVYDYAHCLPLDVLASSVLNTVSDCTDKGLKSVMYLQFNLQ